MDIIKNELTPTEFLIFKELCDRDFKTAILTKNIIHIIIKSKNTIDYAYKHGLQSSGRLYNSIVSHGSLDILKSINIHPSDYSIELCNVAAYYGYLEILKYLYSSGHRGDTQTCNIAADNGHLECLQFLIKEGCRWDRNLCKDIISDENLDMVKFLHKEGCRWDAELSYYAAMGGHIKCLQYLHENNCPIDEQACESAIKNGHLDCLQYIHECGIDLSRIFVVGAIGHKTSVQCLEYFYKHCPGNIRRAEAYYNAIYEDNLEVFKYLIENIKLNIPDNIYDVFYDYRKHNITYFKYIYEKGITLSEEMCLKIFEQGHNLEILKYLYEKEYKLNNKIVKFATNNGNLKMLEFLYEKNFLISNNCKYIAAKKKYFNIIRFLHDIGCEFDYQSCIAAAKGGSVEIFKYIYEKYKRFNRTICCEKNIYDQHATPYTYEATLHNDMFIAAAKSGNIEMVKYLRKLGCDWNKRACIGALERGHADMLKYLCENGYPNDSDFEKYY